MDVSSFLMNQRPALALTTEQVYELMSEFVHTERDMPELVDPNKVTRTALALYQLLLQLYINSGNEIWGDNPFVWKLPNSR